MFLQRLFLLIIFVVILLSALQCLQSVNAVEDGGLALANAQKPSLFPGNGQLQRIKREGDNFLSKAKTIGLTVGALLLASVTFGIDMAVTTILTPLVIITLTKNIDLKQIIETCNYRRQQHLANNEGKHNLFKGLLCLPTDDEDKVHKRRFQLDVMKAAFKHIGQRTMALLQKEYKKYQKATEYMDNWGNWNAPKMTRTILLFFETYGLLDHSHLPKVISRAVLEKEQSEATEVALKELNAIDPEFVRGEIEKAKQYLRESTPSEEEAEAHIEHLDDYLRQATVDKVMKEAADQVQRDYAQKSVYDRLRKLLMAAADTMRKITGQFKDEDEAKNKKRQAVLEAEKKSKERAAALASMPDDTLTVWERIEKYGLLNYSVVTTELLEHLEQDFCSRKSSLIRARVPEGNPKAEKVEEERQRRQLLAQMGEVQANKKPAGAEDGGNEPPLEDAVLLGKGAKFYLDPIVLAKYPKLIRAVVRLAFERLKLLNQETMVVEKGVEKEKKKVPMADRPPQIQKLFLQQRLKRFVVLLLKRMVAQESPSVQRYYLRFELKKTGIQVRFDKLRNKCHINVTEEWEETKMMVGSKQEATTLPKEIAEKIKQNRKTTTFQHFAEKDAFAEVKPMLERFNKWTLQDVGKWWLELEPEQAKTTMMNNLYQLCIDNIPYFIANPMPMKKNLFERAIHLFQFRPQRLDMAEEEQKAMESCEQMLMHPMHELFEKFHTLSTQPEVPDWTILDGILATVVEEQRLEFKELVDHNLQSKMPNKVQPEVKKETEQQQPAAAENAVAIADEQPDMSSVQPAAVKMEAQEHEQHFAQQQPAAAATAMAFAGQQLADGKTMAMFEVQPEDIHIRRKRFVLTTVLTNILRTAAWMQWFKLFNVVEIVRDCIVRSINYQQWGCEMPPLIQEEQKFIHKLKRILMQELSCKALPEIRALYDDFVRKHMAGQKRPSPSELLAQAELEVPYRWEEMLDGFSSEGWAHFGEEFRKRCQDHEAVISQMDGS